MAQNVSYKFLGGKIVLREGKKDQKLPDGSLASWEKAMIIEVGKVKIPLGQSFIDVLEEHEAEIREFVKDVE